MCDVSENVIGFSVIGFIVLFLVLALRDHNNGKPYVRDDV